MQIDEKHLRVSIQRGRLWLIYYGRLLTFVSHLFSERQRGGKFLTSLRSPTGPAALDKFGRKQNLKGLTRKHNR
jgi:hypothetical protein